MTLSKLIEFLEKRNPNQIVEFGFGRPMSYRGDYSQLAFEPKRSVTIGEMLTHAKSALGKTFTGYKGGEYTMDDYTDCWLAEYGSCGETIGEVLLKFMVGETP